MLYRIEVRDIFGDWRGLFRAVPRVPIGDILTRMSLLHRAPWSGIDLSRNPRFFFTESAWDSFGYTCYRQIQQRLNGDVRLLVVSDESVAKNIHLVDDIQVVVYDEPAAAQTA